MTDIICLKFIRAIKKLEESEKENSRIRNYLPHLLKCIMLTATKKRKQHLRIIVSTKLYLPYKSSQSKKNVIHA